MIHRSKERLEQALELKSLLVSLSTGGDFDSERYRELRFHLLDDPATRPRVPAFVSRHRDSAELWSYLKGVCSGKGAYEARRAHIREEFNGLLEHLESPAVPVDAGVGKALVKYDADGVTQAWDRALMRRSYDPEGAITAARTFLEEVCQHILEDEGIEDYEKLDLPQLYSKTSSILKLAPSQHTEDIFRRILGGCQSVVESLGSLRNKASDAHGGGRRRVKPKARHAALAVNLAGSMAMFLIETSLERQLAIRHTENQRQGSGPDEVYLGVELCSRKEFKFEILEMRRIIDAMDANVRERLERIWCDSKAGSTYTVTVRDGMWISGLDWQVHAAIVQSCSGYNGVYFDGDSRATSSLDCFWSGDDPTLDAFAERQFR
ncbi:MAG: abortive infection family protein [Roseicyclus sp.]|jgi:hypothetical protein|nr:abortive infection family protein [Roseicyclus sp.]